MMRNPIIPYLITAIFGILLIIVLSSVGFTKIKHEAREGDSAVVIADPEEIYSASCASCHGGDLEGAMGPALDDVGAKYDVDEIADIIENGLGTDMPGGLVKGEEQQLLAEWLAEQE